MSDLVSFFQGLAEITGLRSHSTNGYLDEWISEYTKEAENTRILVILGGASKSFGNNWSFQLLCLTENYSNSSESRIFFYFWKI